MAYSSQEICSCFICVDDYSAKEIKGRLYNTFNTEIREFENIISLMMSMEQLFNQYEYPDGRIVLRSFSESAKQEEFGGEEREGESLQYVMQGKEATFLVKVLFRRNATWQGTVLWMDSRRKESFRSAFELAALMDSALSDVPDVEGSLGNTGYTGNVRNKRNEKKTEALKKRGF